MSIATTHDITVSVETFFYGINYQRQDGMYVYGYNVTIENRSDYAVQLLRRHWFIIDSNGEKREVEGEGVIGEQPVLLPGEIHKYSSGCNLFTDMGKMFGTYQFSRVSDERLFEVVIPEFFLIVPSRLN